MKTERASETGMPQCGVELLNVSRWLGRPRSAFINKQRLIKSTIDIIIFTVFMFLFSVYE